MNRLALLALILLAPAAPATYARGCSGGANCTACKNCHDCKWCAKQGGTCSVCKRRSAAAPFQLQYRAPLPAAKRYRIGIKKRF